MDSSPPFEEWCRRIATSDIEAFEALFRALHPPLLRYAIGLTKDRDQADDFVQEAFVRVWEKRTSLDPSRSIRALLYRSVRNRAYNATRDRQLHAEKHEELGAMTPSPIEPDALAQAVGFEGLLKRWIDLLPVRQREALTLSRYEGLNHSEIAEAMDVSPRTVNNHLVAALKTLRDHVNAYDPTLLAR